MAPHTERLRDVDVAKGIAIVLVVWGHVVARDARPAGNDWYVSANAMLYAFHMAFFFYLAGYVYWLTPVPQLGARVRRAAARMVPAYLMLALMVFAAKWLAAPYLHVDRPLHSWSTEWLTLMLHPTEAFASFLWFVVVLLELYVLSWVSSAMVERRYALLVSIALSLHLLSVRGYVSELFAMQQVCRYWLFFVLGRWALQHREAVLPVLRRGAWLWLALFGVALFVVPAVWLPTVAALLSLPALHGLALKLLSLPVARVLTWLGNNSWTIFLMNSLALGAARGVVLKTTGWDGAMFYWVAPTLLAAGLLGPVLVQRLMFARVPWFDRVTR